MHNGQLLHLVNYKIYKQLQIPANESQRTHQTRTPSNQTLTQKQIEYQNEPETRPALMETIKQMQIIELAINIKENINTSVKKVFSK